MSRKPRDLTIDLAGARVLTTRLPPGLAADTPDAPGPAAGLVVEFAVIGRPCPWRAPTVTRRGPAFKAPKLVAWQRLVADHARLAMGGRPPHAGPVELAIVFRLTRRAGSIADLSNLVKSTEDALQGIVIVNDKQVCMNSNRREVAATDSATVRVWAREGRPCE